MAGNKQFWETVCPTRRHGLRGSKSNSTHWFVKMRPPKSRKPSHHTGCPYCLIEAKEATK